MNEAAIIDGLIWFVCLLGIITVHEFGHAWMAWKCGDDTARLQGRVTLNPAAHIDPVGTLLLPLLIVFLSAAGSGLAGFIIGWGRPVPVNIFNLRHRRRDDILVSLAGPVMNLILAVVALAVARAAAAAGSSPVADAVAGGFTRMAGLSVLLCFFNLLPIPPLDGSRVVWNAFRLGDELFLQISQWGFFIVLLAIRTEPVSQYLAFCETGTMGFLMAVMRF